MRQITPECLVDRQKEVTNQSQFSIKNRIHRTIMKLSSFLTLPALAIFLLGTSIQLSAAPSPPTITHAISGLTATVSWTNVPGATKYKLLYAPIPYTGPESIGSLDVGGVNSFSANLWVGAAFYVAVQAGNDTEFSEFSNIDTITILSTSANLNGNWRFTETWGPNNCGYPVGMQFTEDILFTQTGNSITAFDDSLNEFSGNLAGNSGSLTYSFDDEETSETKTINFTLLPDNTLSGSISWKSRDKIEGSRECLMNFSFIATNTPAN